jgi:hypothetical protein
MVRDFHPAGDPQSILAQQKDYAKRAFELTMQNTRDIAELTKKPRPTRRRSSATDCAKA